MSDKKSVSLHEVLNSEVFDEDTYDLIAGRIFNNLKLYCLTKNYWDVESNRPTINETTLTDPTVVEYKNSYKKWQSKYEDHLVHASNYYRVSNNILNGKNHWRYVKEILGLQYESLKSKINVIQISVIVLSTLITFLESIKEKLGLQTALYMTVIPIVCSTYIALILAISRFYKLDDKKEYLYKLNEKLALIISRLQHRRMELGKLLPVTYNWEPRDFDGLYKKIADFDKDGLDDMISNVRQECEVIQTMREQIKYKNDWIKLYLDKQILDVNKKNVHKHSDKIDLTSYKKKKSWCQYYFCCYNCDSKQVVNEQELFEAAQIISGLPKKDLESIKRKGVRLNTENAKQFKPSLINDRHSKSTQVSDDNDSNDNFLSFIEADNPGIERNQSGHPTIDISNLHLDDHNGPIKKTHIKIFNNSQKPVLSTNSPSLIVNATEESSISDEYSSK
tara:strand:+ start:2869 stop:4215 length:1347 start_codon:yes stop_codon:yes gene_type:complete